MKTFNSTELTPGEFFDRLTIIIRKAFYNPENYLPKLKEYIRLLNSNDLPGELIELICMLQMINTDIWNLESKIRKGKEGELGLTEVGKRALEIRDVNAKRIYSVNEINKIFGIEIKETKFDHASE